MAKDLQHQNLSFNLNEISHEYGNNVHIISSPQMLSLLAKLGHPDTHQPQINELVSMLYSHLMDIVIDHAFPQKQVTLDTRMKAIHPEASYEGKIVNPDQASVIVDLARAGTLPSHVCYSKLNYLLNPRLVRQDHFYVARMTNDKNEVVGVNVSGSKIGGDIENAIVLFPDPMGATGGTISRCVNHYLDNIKGKPFKMIAMHLIITPEYLKRVTMECPDLKIYALRLDRGLSGDKILSERPGTHWKDEKGLNDHQYIVPGAGGLGEILNNSYC